jgi:hypothetical protein
MQPYEIVCSPYTVWTAPVGTAFPKVDVAPLAPVVGPPAVAGWTQVGTSGNKNYTDTGVTVTHGQTINTFVPAGSTTPRKAWRTGETLTVAFSLADVSPAQYALVLDNVAITTTAPATGVAGNQAFQLMRGVQVNMYALLVRGISSVNEALTAQYEVPACYQSGTPAPVYSKANPAELAVQFEAFELTPGIFGTLRVQTAAGL